MPQPARRSAVPSSSPMVPPPPPLTQPETTPDPAPQQAGPLATVPHQQPAPQQSHVSANMFANTGPAAATAAGQGGGGMSIPLDSLVGNGTDPETDRKPEAYRIPRYVLDAVDAAHRLRIFRDGKGKALPKQEIATRALKEFLPPELLDAAYAGLYGRERPTD